MIEIPDELSREDVMDDARKLREALQQSGMSIQSQTPWEKLGEYRQERHAATVLSLYAQGYRIIGPDEDCLSETTHDSIQAVLEVVESSRAQQAKSPEVLRAIAHLDKVLHPKG